jgi:hypothetical protein
MFANTKKQQILFPNGELRKATDTMQLLNENLELVYKDWLKEEIKKIVAFPHVIQIPQEFRTEKYLDSIRYYIKKYDDENYYYSLSENKTMSEATLNINVDHSDVDDRGFDYK